MRTATVMRTGSVLTLGDRRQDYIEPPKDTSPMKVKITRTCWVKVKQGAPAERIEAGTVLTLPHWQAVDLAAWCEKAEIL